MRTVYQLRKCKLLSVSVNLCSISCSLAALGMVNMGLQKNRGQGQHYQVLWDARENASKENVSPTKESDEVQDNG